jgi:large subunit ribosomal protein L25
VVPGGLLDQSLTTLAVTAEATNIPSSVDVSVEGLAVGASVHAGDIELPAGVEISGETDQVVIHVVAAPTAEDLEAEGGDAEAPATGDVVAEDDAEGAEPAEGDSAAE